MKYIICILISFTFSTLCLSQNELGSKTSPHPIPFGCSSEAGTLRHPGKSVF